MLLLPRAFFCQWMAIGRPIFAGLGHPWPPPSALQALPTYNVASGDYLGMAYAVAYPFGIMGIILTMLLVRRIFPSMLTLK